MDWRIGRRSRGPGKAPVLVSMTVHAIVFLLAWWTTLEAESLEYMAIDIELVTLPATEAEEEPAPPSPPEEELVVDTPEPTPIPEEPPEAVVETDEPEPPPPTPEPPPEEPRPEPAAEDEAVSAEGGDDLTVRMEGLQRDFPAYYANIIRQLRRCFRWQGRGDLEASVDFVLGRDGSVIPSTMNVSEPSGSIVFDLTVMEAVECAGSGRFGPLPEAMALESLPIRFTFSPSGTAGRRPPGGDPDAAAGIRRSRPPGSAPGIDTDGGAGQSPGPVIPDAARRWDQ